MFKYWSNQMYILNLLIADSQVVNGNCATQSHSRCVQSNPNASYPKTVDASLSSTLIPEVSQMNSSAHTYYI